MDEGYKDTLSTDHLERLAWFEEHAGQISAAPQPLAEERYLVSAPKGIFKPKGWDYALSIKIMPDSPYEDGRPVAAEGGGWQLSYHQEGEDPRFYTNAALARCIRDRVPVGVLRKVDGRRPVRYEIMGLALPVSWQRGNFLLDGLSPLHSLEDAETSPAATVEDVAEALRTLRVQKTGDGQGKRHQPLTLLWAIGRAQQRASRMVAWPVARERIGDLIQEFGAAPRDSAYLPFLALAGTGMWDLTGEPPRGVESSARRRWLNTTAPAVEGGLTRGVYDLLAGSANAAAEVARFLLDAYFEDMSPAQLLRVMRATGLEGLPEISGISRPQKSPNRPTSGSGARRMADTALRIAIETHAVRRASAHYRAQGYEVTEVGKPYDLRAVKGSEELHVEVKGSILAADDVELTIGEVRHSREIRTDLYVVDQIQWEVQADETIRTTGGRERIWPDWQPSEEALAPTRFRYRLPGG